MSFYFTTSFFQIKTDAPSESRIYPTGPEEGEDKQHPGREDSVKVICPWESPAEWGRAG